jgi:enoyl-CoA hydratase
MIHVDRHGPVTLLTIDRQARRNALDHEALEQLLAGLAAVTDAHHDRQAEGDRASDGDRQAHGDRERDELGGRVLVLTGAGGHFCAGADLTTVEDGEFLDLLHQLLEGIRTAPFPSIAAIDGAALGLGTQLAVACDLRVATPSATFGIPAAKLGLMTDQWTMGRLAGFVGQGPARAMCLAAETYTGADVHRLGFVQRLAEPDQLLDDALGWAAEIATLAPLTIAGFKVGLNEAEDLVAWTPAYRAAFEAAWASDDLQEGLAAFGQRRPPRFRGT